MTDVPDVRINASDAMELGQVLDFLAGWFSREDPRRHAAYADFVGHDGADLTEVRDILARFAFLLGEDDDGQRLPPFPSTGGRSTGGRNNPDVAPQHYHQRRRCVALRRPLDFAIPGPL